MIKKDIQNLKGIRNIIQEYIPSWTLAAFLNSFQSLFVDLCFGYTIKYMLDSIEKGSSYIVLAIIIMVLGAVYLIIGLPILSYLLDKSVSNIKCALHIHIVQKINKIKYSEIQKKHSAFYLSVLQNDVDEALNMFNWNFVGLLQALVSGIGSLILIFIYCWQMGVISLAAGISLLILCNSFVGVIHKDSEYLQNLSQQRMEKTMDFIDNFVLLKIFKMVKIISESINDILNDKLHRENSYNLKINIMNTIKLFITDVIFFSGIFLIGCFFISNKQLTYGTLMLIVQLCNGVVFLFSYISSYISGIQNALVSINRINEICNLEEENTDEKIILNADNGVSVEFKDVFFKYNDKHDWIIKNLSFKINQYSKVKIVGKNGAGKSTIFKLLLKVFEPQSGNIYINGINIKKLSLDTITKFIVYVPQQVTLYNDSLLNNILLGKEIDSKTLSLAIKCAELDEFINSKPDGIKYSILENGKNVSSGEKQRIGLARALVCKPKLILLDELNANLDVETSNRIFTNISEHFPSMGIMSVEHIESNIEYMDSNIICL